MSARSWEKRNILDGTTKKHFNKIFFFLFFFFLFSFLPRFLATKSLCSAQIQIALNYIRSLKTDPCELTYRVTLQFEGIDWEAKISIFSFFHFFFFSFLLFCFFSYIFIRHCARPLCFLQLWSLYRGWLNACSFYLMI